jgi:RimJ/RimL family protein N-acetyltransferase
MQTRYFKRYRMEIDFRRTMIPPPVLPEGYRWCAWHPCHFRRHAAVKWASFYREVDSRLFLSLATYRGCLELMRGIIRHEGFHPVSTWLIESVEEGMFGEAGMPEETRHLRAPACGTIQGLRQSKVLGSIQNVGIVPEHRGLGLGRALVLKALAGFRAYGLVRVYLDVTADNHAAVELYRSIGFRHTKTRYLKPVEPVEPIEERAAEFAWSG